MSDNYRQVERNGSNNLAGSWSVGSNVAAFPSLAVDTHPAMTYW